jgi:hypothetical protein
VEEHARGEAKLIDVAPMASLSKRRNPVISRLIKTLRLPVATLALVLTIFAVSSAPVAAHSKIVDHGNDYALTDSDHRSGAVCDREKDDHIVSAYWMNDDGRVAYAEDTTDAGCEQADFHGQKATKMYVCEFGIGFSDCTRIYKV